MNRVGLGLAVGAGYVLGRTKKMKMAFALGGLVAGKRMHLSPRMLADVLSQQLQNNPQFKEIGDQLREDMRGVGKAASGAMVERQMSALADRLHGRTAQVRDQLSGVAGKATGGLSSEEDEDEDREDTEEEPREEHEEEPQEEHEDEPRDEHDEEDEPRDEHDDEEPEADEEESSDSDEDRAPVRRTAKKAAKKAPAKKTAAKRAPAKKTAAKRTSGGQAPAKKAAKKTAAAGGARGARSRQSKGGGE
ncbi:DNA primase [Streptomyces sp. NPDC101209]|uniref:DNA primase n=1 Tax=Streptomyces sp. NPDC101209 TaxID=3366129 RepID=UPI00380D087B